MKRYILSLLVIILVYAHAYAQAPSSFYQKYYGSIDAKYDIVMDLLVMDTVASGSYYYVKKGIPLALRGTVKNGTIVLNEENEKGESTGTFEGSIDSFENFTGTWKNPKGLSFPFKLHDDYSHGAVKLKPGEYHISYNPVNEYGFSFSSEYLVLEGNPDKAVEDAINGSLYHVKLKGNNTGEAIRNSIKADVDSILISYKEAVKEAQADTSGEVSMATYTWEAQSSMDVVFNEKDLLGIAVNVYEYTGGAHGNYGTVNYLYDTKIGKEVKLDALFLPGYKEKLTGLLADYYRKIYEVPPGQSLVDAGLFVDKIEPNENFYITRNGIGFIYVPYEIGPYVMGQQDIVVPFSELKGLIAPQGPIGWAKRSK
jgi:hypothetical protein